LKNVIPSVKLDKINKHGNDGRVIIIIMLSACISYLQKAKGNV